MEKTSQYNVFINRGKTSVVYNTLWESFLVADTTQVEPLRKGLVESSCYANANFYSTLIERKMIIDNDIDELGLARETYERTNNNSSCYELTIDPTLACNFRCWYCYESHNDRRYINKSEVDNIITFLNGIVESGEVNKLVIKFFGGEPLLCYNSVIKPILIHADTIRKRNIRTFIHITTNGSLLSNKRLSFLKDYGVDGFQITLDGNRERHNKVRFHKAGDDSYTRIVHNIIDAVSLGLNVCIRLNISEDTKLDVDNLLDDFTYVKADDKAHLSFSIMKVWQAHNSVVKDIDGIVRKIRDAGFKCSDYYSSPTSIWRTCYADKRNHFTINPRGEIFKCTARNFSKDKIEGHLLSGGTIEWTPLHYERINVSPFNFSSCLECRILPICAGGCSQHLLESRDRSKCPLGMTDDKRTEYAYRVLSEKLERI